MAGSYDHICADGGSFTMDLIDNMGDAYEALEDCHGIIAQLCEALEGFCDDASLNCSACGLAVIGSAAALESVRDVSASENEGGGDE